MADSIVTLVLRKLTDAVVQEALFLHGVQDKVNRVQRDLAWIDSFLKDADTMRHKDERVKLWVKEAQQVGFLIEELLEKLLAEVAGDRPEGLRSILKKMGKMPMKPIAKHKLGNKIDKIQQRICEISENITKYKVEGLKETSGEASAKKSIKQSVNPDIDETEVVGFEVDRKTILDQLLDTDIMRRSVVSIVGAGGSGKTTLAMKVYKSAEVKCAFGSCMWLPISQDYKLIDILRKMLVEIGDLNSENENLRKMLEKIGKLISENENKGQEYLIPELNKCMKERKYLVVLDDIWSNDVWTELKDVLPNANNGSRVFIKIAEEADTESKPHEIQPLNEEESKQLLLKTVFPNKFSKECPNGLLPLATQFAEKCGGWPLALVVVAGILSIKNPDYIIWDEVVQKMNWKTDGSSFTEVISPSYDDLPTALKPCFKYFGVFPKNYQIKATTLIQLWIAEGFILQDETKLLEDIAESYLEELVQRCMVQVSRRSCIGKIKYCQVHDLLRDLAIQKAEEDNFLTVVSKDDTMLSRSTCARRVALHGYGDKMIEHACTNLRSLINFGDVPNFSTYGALLVLHISREPYRRDQSWTNLLKGLNALTALKYIGLEGYLANFCQSPTGRFFKRSPVTYWKNLQTVRTRGCTSYGKLPPSFWGNKQLRHIYLSFCPLCGIVPEGPPSTTNLPSLLTLKRVRARQDWVQKLPQFPSLRKLGIVIPEDVAWEPLIKLLSNLNYLGSLHLEMSHNKPMTFPSRISGFKNYNRLHSFYLVNGRWPRKVVVDCNPFPPHLTKLVLERVCYEEDPMPQLGKLPDLKVLKLNGEIKPADGKQMIICSRGDFGRLQRLVLEVDGLEEWKIEEGAMPMLNQLMLKNCRKLERVPDLQYLVNPQELETSSTDDKELLYSKLKGEDRWKIEHIPSVIIMPIYPLIYPYQYSYYYIEKNLEECSLM